MLQTVEAIVEPSGSVRLLEQLHVDHPCRAVVTLVEAATHAPDARTVATSEAVEWRRFVGVLKDSPHFNGDPITAQRTMRNEWE